MRAWTTNSPYTRKVNPHAGAVSGNQLLSELRPAVVTSGGPLCEPFTYS